MYALKKIHFENAGTTDLDTVYLSVMFMLQRLANQNKENTFLHFFATKDERGQNVIRRYEYADDLGSIKSKVDIPIIIKEHHVEFDGRALNRHVTDFSYRPVMDLWLLRSCILPKVEYLGVSELIFTSPNDAPLVLQLSGDAIIRDVLLMTDNADDENRVCITYQIDRIYSIETPNGKYNAAFVEMTNVQPEKKQAMQLRKLPKPTNLNAPSTDFHGILAEFNTALQPCCPRGHLKSLEVIIQELVNVRHAATCYIQKGYVNSGKIDQEVYFMCGQLDSNISRANELLSFVGNKEVKAAIKKHYGTTKGEVKKLRLWDILKMFIIDTPRK